MATIFLIDTKQVEDERKLNLAPIILDRWAERQAGAAFLSAESDFILTDYNRNHREIDLLVHLLNCNGLEYRAIGNVDLQGLGEDLWKKTFECTQSKDGKQNEEKSIERTGRACKRLAISRDA